MTTRKEAIESGINNAVDTVCIDKEMTAEQALANLRDFVADGLACYGYGSPTSEDMEYAKICWPL